MPPNALVSVCVYDLTNGSPVARGNWQNGNVVFLAHAISHVDGATKILAVDYQLLKPMIADTPGDFVDPNEMNDKVRGLIGNSPAQFESSVIYENCRSCGGGASAQFHLSPPQ